MWFLSKPPTRGGLISHAGISSDAFRSRGAVMPMVRRQVTPWRVAKRCVMFLTTLCVIPVLLVLLVITDQYSRPFGPRNFYQHQEVSLKKPPVPPQRPVTTHRINFRRKQTTELNLRPPPHPHNP